MDDDHLDLYELDTFDALPGIDLGLWLRLLAVLLVLVVAGLVLLA